MRRVLLFAFLACFALVVSAEMGLGDHIYEEGKF
jgi:hypothetical protein